MKLMRVLAALSIVAVLGAACGGDDGDTEASGDGGGGGGSVTLTAADFAFDPESLSVAAGDTIEFVNEDDAEHNITVEDADIDEDAEAGDTTTVDVGEVEAGSYDFFCKYHPDQMTGTLEVTG